MTNLLALFHAAFYLARCTLARCLCRAASAISAGLRGLAGWIGPGAEAEMETEPEAGPLGWWAERVDAEGN